MSKQPRQGVSQTIGDLTQGIKRLGFLYIQKARLHTAEKISVLLSTVAFTAVVLALALVLMVFVTIGVGHLLATSIAPHLAYLIVAGFYLIVLIVVISLRRQLFIDPITRFMSRLLVDSPDNAVNDDSAIMTLRSQRKKGEAEPAESENKDDEINEGDYDEIAQRIALILRRASSGNDDSDDNDADVSAPTDSDVRTDDDDSDNNPEGGEL